MEYEEWVTNNSTNNRKKKNLTTEYKFNNTIIEQIWKDRYQKNNETTKENLERVSEFVSDTPQCKKDIFNIMAEGLFFFGGRTMSNAGIGEDLTVNNCFKAGSKVITSKGLVNIENVQIGDKVVTENDTWQTVTKVLCRDYEGDMYKISGASLYDDIYCTPNHKFLTQNGWVRADRLLYSVDKLKTSNTTFNKKYEDIKDIEVIEDQKCKVYNLSVNNVNSYTVNGVVVHNCFVSPQIQDSLQDIFDKVKLGAVTHQKGGGIGYDFSLLRPKGTHTSNDAIASGALSFMDVFNAQTSTILQGNRRGANMGIMNIYDMDIEEFITAKSNNPNRLNHFNLSVMVDDDFMNAVKNDEDIYLHFPVYDEKSHIVKDSNKWKQKKKISATYLWDLIMSNAYNNGEPGVFFYDNANNDNNLKYIETICCSNPCFEYLAGTTYGINPVTKEPIDSSQYGGACNLGSIMLQNYVLNPFTIQAKFDMESFNNDIKTIVRCLDNIIDVNHFPDKIYENYQKSFRTIGLGVTGLADMLAMLNHKYDSLNGRKFVDYLMNEIAKKTYKASIELAKEKGSFPFLNKDEFIQSGYLTKHAEQDDEWNEIIKDIHKYGIRNGKMLSVAPCGTMSLVWGNNCSSGIEPIFALNYERKIRMGGQSEEDEQIIEMTDYAYDLAKKSTHTIDDDLFTTALNIDVDSHIDMLSVVAKHIDMSVSKTINVPTEYTFEQTKDIYTKCWKLGIKGCTIFRPNEIRQGILLTDNNNQKENSAQLKELPRGFVYKVNDDLIGIKRKITNGCGKFHLQLFFDELTGEPYETFIAMGDGGGCERNLEFESKLISTALRGGVPIEAIIDTAKSVRPCKAFCDRTRAKGDTSKGTSCPSAIGWALEELNNKIQDRCFVDYDYIVEENDKNKCDIKNVENNKLDTFKCPECGEQLVYEGGCVICKNGCGWSKCE